MYTPKPLRLSNKQKIQNRQRLFNKTFDAKNYLNFVEEVNDVDLIDQTGSSHHHIDQTETTNVSNDFLNDIFENYDFKLNDHEFNSTSDYEFYENHVLQGFCQS